MTKTEFVTRWLLHNADNDFSGDDAIRNEINEAARAFDYLKRVFVLDHSPYVEPDRMQPFDFVAEWLLRNSDYEEPDVEAIVQEALEAYRLLAEVCESS